MSDWSVENSLCLLFHKQFDHDQQWLSGPAIKPDSQTLPTSELHDHDRLEHSEKKTKKLNLIVGRWQSSYVSVKGKQSKQLFLNERHCLCQATGRYHMSYVMRKPVYAICKQQHPCSLISAFVVRCLDSIILLVSISEISSLWLASVELWAGGFGSTDPEDRFSRNMAHIRTKS